MTENKPVHLGDGVYAVFEPGPGVLELYTSDGIEKSESLFLDEEQVENLLEYIEQKREY